MLELQAWPSTVSTPGWSIPPLISSFPGLPMMRSSSTCPDRYRHLLLVPTVSFPFVPTQNFSLRGCCWRYAGPLFWLCQRSGRCARMCRWETPTLLKHNLDQGASKAELSRRFGVNRRTIHYWIGTGQLDRNHDTDGSGQSPQCRWPHPGKAIRMACPAALRQLARNAAAQAASGNPKITARTCGIRPGVLTLRTVAGLTQWQSGSGSPPARKPGPGSRPRRGARCPPRGRRS